MIVMDIMSYCDYLIESKPEQYQCNETDRILTALRTGAYLLGIALARLLAGMVHVNDQTVNDLPQCRWAASVSPAMDRVLAASTVGTNSPNGSG